MSVITVLGELSPAKSPWLVCAYDGVVVLVNEEHEPLVVVNSKLIKTHPLPSFNDSVRDKVLSVDRFLFNK